MREREAREIPGLRYETCRGCGLRWNIAKGQTIPNDTKGRIPLPTLPVGADDIQTK